MLFRSYGLIQTKACAHSHWPIRDQGGYMGPFLLTNQDFLFEFHHGITDQSEFFDNFTMQGYKRRVTIGEMLVWLLFQ